MTNEVTQPVMELEAASAAPEEAQRRVLTRHLVRAAQTAYGRDRGIRPTMTYEEYAKEIPIVEYSDIQPYIERTVAGEQGVIVPEHVDFFTRSSATSGGAKSIPVHDLVAEELKAFYAIEKHFRRRANPGVGDGAMLGFIGRIQGTFPSGARYGSAFGWHAERLVQGGIFDRTGTYDDVVPFEAWQLSSTRARMYAILRFALQVADLRQLHQTNPAGVLVYAKCLAEDAESLIRDIRDGGIQHPEISRELAEKWAPFLQADPARATALTEAASRDGQLTLRGAWPRLDLIRCWATAGAGMYRDELAKMMPGLKLWEWGFSASEGRVSVNVNDQGHCLPMLTQTFYEVRTKDGVRPWYEIQDGEEGELLLTNSRGLYRYVLGDLVGSVGRIGATPLIQFRRRMSAVASWTGEKITEEQVVKVVTEALADAGLKSKYYCLAPFWDAPPRHYVMIEFTGRTPSDDEAYRLAADIERRFNETNPEYTSKRETLRLGPMGLVVLEDGALERYVLKRVATVGGDVGRVKPPRVTMDVKFLNEFSGRRFDVRES